jgi:metal-sulfur cluster biosynthetic enzyme
MDTVTKEQVYEALKECYDPEIPVNIVDLGLIYDVKIEDQNMIYMTMTLTTPGCGMARAIALEAKEKARSVPGVKDAFVTVVWDPPWNPGLMSPEAKAKLGINE